jgi:hypothetical protein
MRRSLSAWTPVKWDSKIEQEPHYSPIALREAIKQIASRTLFRSPWCPLLVYLSMILGLILKMVLVANSIIELEF